MATVTMALERKVSSSEEALMLLKQLVETEAPLDVIRDVIGRACEELDLLDRPGKQACSKVTSDLYLG